MPRRFVQVAALGVGLLASGAAAQTVASGPALTTRLPDGTGNSVLVLEAEAGRLLAGPRLIIVAPDGTVRFAGADDAFDPPTAIDPRVFALAAQGDRIWAGLGFSDFAADADEPPPTAAGFALSTDGGQTWRRRFAALDQTSDTLVTYGVSTLRAVPTLAPQGAAPLDLALDASGDTLYAALGLAGLRRTTDGGATWHRIVLPPDSLTVLDPRDAQTFAYSPGQIEPSEPGDPAGSIRIAFASSNFIAYSVLVDETGTVWAGTANGLNRSVRLPGVTDLAWLRYLDSPLGNAPSGNLIYALAAQPDTTGPDPVWIASWNSGLPGSSADEEDGVTVWRGDDADGFAVFETVLLGVRAYGFAFEPGRAYVATGRDGLQITDDGGTSWRAVRTFRDAEGRALPLRTDVGVFAVAVAPTGLWAGTSDGLLRSRDRGATWELFRASPSPGVDADSAAVDVYAYPNPFRPGTDRQVRVRFDLGAPGAATLRVFDVSMRPVRTIDVSGRPAGANEVLWDGLSDGGLRVANGAYIYVLDADGRQRSGRLLVFE